MTKIHWAHDVRRCSCGDSFCTDDYLTDEMIACGARTHAHERTRQTSDVTCMQCRSTRIFRDVLRSEELLRDRKKAEKESAPTGLRLYVWNEVVGDLWEGTCFALASSVEEARRMCAEEIARIEEDVKEGPEPIEKELAQMKPMVFSSSRGFFVDDTPWHAVDRSVARKRAKKAKKTKEAS